MSRFNHLNVPNSWRHYWTKYPEGYTILEALLNWVAQVDSMVDNVNNWNDYLEDFVENFDEKLAPTVRAILAEMEADGRLAEIINEEIFGELNSKVDKAEKFMSNAYVDITLPPYNAKADALYRDELTGKWYSDALLTVPATPVGDIINQAIQDTLLTGNTNIYIPAGFYFLDKPIVLIQGIRLRGAGNHYQELLGTALRLDGDYHAMTTGLVTEDVVDMRSILIEDIIFRGNSTIPHTSRTNHGLDAVHMRYNVQVNRVGFKYFKYGMYLNHVWKANFHDVLCNYNDVGVYMINQCNRVSFYECEFNRNESASVFSSPDGLKNESILIIGCLIEKNNGHAIRLTNVEAVTIMNCYIENNHWHSILIDPVTVDWTTEVGTVNIMNNRFYGNSNYSYADTAIYIGDGGVKNVRIDGNHMNFFKVAIIRMYLNAALQVEIGQNVWGNSPNFVSYLNSGGNKPIIKQAGYMNLNGNKLRGAVIESFYNNQLPTDDVYDGRIAYDLTNHCLTVYSQGAWKKLTFTI